MQRCPRATALGPVLPQLQPTKEPQQLPMYKQTNTQKLLCSLHVTLGWTLLHFRFPSVSEAMGRCWSSAWRDWAHSPFTFPLPSWCSSLKSVPYRRQEAQTLQTSCTKPAEFQCRACRIKSWHSSFLENREISSEIFKSLFSEHSGLKLDLQTS